MPADCTIVLEAVSNTPSVPFHAVVPNEAVVAITTFAPSGDTAIGPAFSPVGNVPSSRCRRASKIVIEPWMVWID